jgi:hypothetical protein
MRDISGPRTALGAGLAGALLLLAAPCWPAGTASAAPPVEARPALDEAERLLAAGQAAKARELLAAHEAEWAGALRYDYLLGVAALDSGRPAEAIFSLERALASDPGFDGARMELARAQFEAGDLESARTQFAWLATRAPPAGAARAIERYIAAIDARAGARRQRWSAWLDAGAGYDSNANGSTADEQFLGLTLDQKNVETDSPYYTLGAGVGHSAGYANGLASASSLRLDWRSHSDAHFVDQAVAGAATALYWNMGHWRANAGASGYYGVLDGNAHQSYLGLDAGLARLLGSTWEVGVRVQGGPLTYRDEQLEVLDVDRYLGALALTRHDAFTPGGRMSVALLAGTDDARHATPSSDYGNDRLGARLTGRWPLAAATGLYAEAAYLQSDYEDSPGFFGTDRKDDQWSALVAIDFERRPADGWTLSPHARWVRNESNVALYAYDRWEAGVNLRRSFR